MFADAPVWFNEGRAEYNSTVEVINGGRRATMGKAIARHVRLLRERRVPFSELFAIDRSSRAYTSDAIDREVLYAQAWTIVHHAFHGPPGRRDQLLAFVGKVAKGGATEMSFREAYGISARQLEREIQLYVAREVYAFGLHELFDRVVTRINADPTRISDAEADAWFADLLSVMAVPTKPPRVQRPHWLESRIPISPSPFWERCTCARGGRPKAWTIFTAP